MASKLSAELIVLAIPTFGVIGAFGSFIVRSFAQDPEIKLQLYGYDDPKAADIGRTYRMQFQQAFKGGSTSIFNNDVKLQ